MPRKTRQPTEQEKALIAEHYEIRGDFSFIVGWDPQPGWFPGTLMTTGYMHRVDCLRWVMGSLSPKNPIEKWPTDPDACYRFLDDKLSAWKRQPPPPPEGGSVIALYVCNGLPSHVALRTKSGQWESKLGTEPAIIHAHLGLLETKYGQVMHYYIRTPHAASGRRREGGKR